MPGIELKQKKFSILLEYWANDCDNGGSPSFQVAFCAKILSKLVSIFF